MNATRSTKLDAAPLLAALGALLLIISLFLDWYEPGFSAWTVFEVLDLALAVIALLTLAIAAGRLGAGLRTPAVPLWILALAALAIVVSQLVNQPPASQGADIETGAWLALAAVLIMGVSALLGRVHVTLVPPSQADAPAAATTHRTPDTSPTAVAADEERTTPLGK